MEPRVIQLTAREGFLLSGRELLGKSDLLSDINVTRISSPSVGFLNDHPRQLQLSPMNSRNVLRTIFLGSRISVNSSERFHNFAHVLGYFSPKFLFQ